MNVDSLNLLNSMAEAFYEKYNSFMSFSFVNNNLIVKITTSTGLHYQRMYDYKASYFYEELMCIYGNFKNEMLKFSLGKSNIKCTTK